MAHDKKNESHKTGIAGWNEDAGTVSSSDRARASRHQKTQADRRRRIALLVMLAVLCVACIVCFWPLKEQITRSLWLKSGTAVTMEASKDDGSEPSGEELGKSTSMISSRLNAIQIPEWDVRHDGSSIIVSLPWNYDANAVASAAGGSGALEFVRLDEIGDADALSKINAGTQNVPLKKGSYTPFLDGSSVTSCEVTATGTGDYAVTVYFNDEGAQKFADVTREMSEDGGGNIAIVLSGNVCSAPSVSQEISGGTVSISGGFSEIEARAIKASLDTGVLPVETTVKGSEEIGPLIGKAGLWALIGVVVAAVVGIAIGAYVRFRKLGFVVSGAAVVYVLTLLGLMALASRLNMFTLTLSGVAGGMLAAALTIVTVWLECSIFQKMVREGKSVRGAAMSSLTQAFFPLRFVWGLGFFASCVLMFVPVMLTRNFALVFIFGTVCAVFAAVWYSSTLLRLLAMGTIQAAPDAWGVGIADANKEETGTDQTS